jgi:isoquinoline 1-oxidoreductase alpha subunit
MTELTINNQVYDVEADGETPLLWVIRDRAGLTGTKYSCGGGYCGACVVHLDGKPARSCSTSLRSAVGKRITTIEGLSDDRSHPLQKAWIEQQVPQCGYCQSGQIMQAAALLANNPTPTREDIVRSMDSVLCRCGTYGRIIAAIQSAAEEMSA